jgi:predicted O-methyltransferase YrrM
VAGKTFQIKSYFNYWLDAVDEHSLHSPFFFDFYTKVVKSPPVKNEVAEALRHKLIADERTLTVKDLGAGVDRTPVRKISSIARNSVSPPRLSALYHRIIHHFNYRSIIELGTSFGINTLYLTQYDSAKVYTFEGAPEVAEIARVTFEMAADKSIQLIEGDINITLPVFLQSSQKFDFVLLDANHRLEPTKRYFELLLPKIHVRSIIVIDDIHYSSEMEQAWNTLRAHKLVYASADLYRCGFLFFDPSLNKQHVILQF